MEPRVLKLDDRGAGEPLVLVPGGLTGWVSWVPHQERLVNRHRVIRVQPIHNELGSKGIPGDPGYTAQVERESLRLTLDALNLARAHLAGWSGGGLALIEFAIEYPKRVRSLTLVEPAAYWISPSLANASTRSNSRTLRPRPVRPRSQRGRAGNLPPPRRPRRTGRGRAVTPQLGTLGRAPDHAVVAWPAPGSPGAFDRRARPDCGAGPGYQGDELDAGRSPSR